MTDREKKIYERLKHDFDYVRKQGYDVFGVFLQGSQNYELDYEGSDIDTKCIILPSVEDVIFNKQAVSKTLILEDNSHIDLKDIRLMWNCFKKQNINYLEILFTDFAYVPHEYYHFWLDMIRLNEDIAHIDNYSAVNCIVGMILEKNAALCHPYPSLKDKIEKHGYDNKQLHHIIRCREFLDRYIDGEPYEDCLIPTDRESLINIKADYIYNLEQAKELAKEAVDYAKAKKQAYLNSHKQTIDIGTQDKMNKIMVDILTKAWTGE
jgi:predicted nucleotidyltransferase